MNNILEIKSLCKNYNSPNGEVKVLDNISLNIRRGEFLSIVGPSGAGKSTILNILAGLDKNYKGSIISNEKIVSSYMTQEDALFPWLTVLENAGLGLKVQNKLTKENITYVKKLIEKYGLKEFENTRVTELSGGMKQRVG